VSPRGPFAAIAGAAVIAAALPVAAIDDVPATAARAAPARPAESGGHDSAATLGPLAIGADVRDETGADIGRVTRLTTDKAGRQVAAVRDGEATYSIPVEMLYARQGAAFSTVTLAALKKGWKPR